MIFSSLDTQEQPKKKPIKAANQTGVVSGEWAYILKGPCIAEPYQTAMPF